MLCFRIFAFRILYTVLYRLLFSCTYKVRNFSHFHIRVLYVPDTEPRMPTRYEREAHLAVVVDEPVFTIYRAVLAQSAVMRLRVVRLSVRLSVGDDQVP